MMNFALRFYTAQQLLGDELDGDDLIYEDDVLTLLPDSSALTRVHHQLSKSQAKAIMQKIVRDEVIREAVRNGLERARLNPEGDEPTDGSHPVDPTVTLIEGRAILPVLGVLPPITIVHCFARMAYEYMAVSPDPSKANL
jgi:hypothetical protein